MNKTIKKPKNATIRRLASKGCVMMGGVRYAFPDDVKADGKFVEIKTGLNGGFIGRIYDEITEQHSGNWFDLVPRGTGAGKTKLHAVEFNLGSRWVMGVAEWSLDAFTGNVTLHEIHHGRDEVMNMLDEPALVKVRSSVYEQAKNLSHQERVDLIISTMHGCTQQAEL